MSRVLIVGAGLTGCTVAHRLVREGVDCVVLERSHAPGGLIRSARLEGVLHEPHGSHIFHTEDREVWDLATSITPFRPYRHRVDIVVEGQVLNWPPLLSQVERLRDGEAIHAQLLERRESAPDPARRAQEGVSFEEWCLELMGPGLYELFIRPYTEKQWGRPASELPATLAPRRVSVRWDDDPYLFPDPFQGWPAGPNGYTDLVEGLLVGQEGIELRCGVEATLDNLEDLAGAGAPDAIVLTCPLDAFAGERFGALEWRGILVRNVHVPHVDLAQGAMVVNYPGRDYPFIRIHETKHASGQECEGTVLGFEFTGAPARHYPIETERNLGLHARYRDHVREHLGAQRTYFAGRLARYAYLDMDDCMRQALDTADEVLESLGRPARAGAGS